MITFDSDIDVYECIRKSKTIHYLLHLANERAEPNLAFKYTGMWVEMQAHAVAICQLHYRPNHNASKLKRQFELVLFPYVPSTKPHRRLKVRRLS